MNQPTFSAATASKTGILPVDKSVGKSVDNFCKKRSYPQVVTFPARARTYACADKLKDIAGFRDETAPVQVGGVFDVV
jgi:hypothetical protein